MKTELSRDQIHEKMLELTFLSDADYVRKDRLKKFFFGSLSKEDFELHYIGDEKRLTPYISGFLKGVENEMFIFINLKAYRSRRLYVVFLLAILTLLGFMISEILSYGSGVIYNPVFFLLAGLVGILAVYIISTGMRFKKRADNAIQFFRGAFSGEIIAYPDIPVVFRL